MCLLGMAAGEPEDVVLREREGGGVGVREGMSGGREATAAAIVIWVPK